MSSYRPLVYDAEETVTCLLRHHVDPNIQNKWGESALHYAAERGLNGIVKKLIAAKANPNLVDNHGRTALHLASRSNMDETISLLLENGANLNSIDEDGETALLNILYWDRDLSRRSARMLLEAGRGSSESFRIRNNKGSTPLHLAIRYGNVEVTKILLEYGADISDLGVNLRPPNFSTSYTRHVLLSLLKEYREEIEFMDETGSEDEGGSRGNEDLTDEDDSGTERGSGDDGDEGGSIDADNSGE